MFGKWLDFLFFFGESFIGDILSIGICEQT